jgi:hypothetical protein
LPRLVAAGPSPGPVMRVTNWVKRGSACVLVASLALAAAGCADSPKLDPKSEPVASQRKAAVATLLKGARVTADQFGAGAALGARTDTRCNPGTDNWKIHDQFRSTCTVEVTTAYAVDVPPLPVLSAMPEPLKAEGWDPDGHGWVLNRGRGEVADLAALSRGGYHLDDLVGMGYTGHFDSSQVSTPLVDSSLVLRPFASSAVVPEVAPAPVVQTFLAGRPYLVSQEGVDWQVAWAKQRSQHPYLLVVYGETTFAQQPW